MGSVADVDTTSFLRTTAGAGVLEIYREWFLANRSRIIDTESHTFTDILQAISSTKSLPYYNPNRLYNPLSPNASTWLRSVATNHMKDLQELIDAVVRYESYGPPTVSIVIFQALGSLI